MKKTILLTILATLVASYSYAQQPNMSVYGHKGPAKPSKVGKMLRSLRYSDEIVLGIGLDHRSRFEFGDLVTANYRFGDTLSLGLGTGLLAMSALESEHYFYSADDVSSNYALTLLLPIYVRAKVSPYRFGDWTPFARADIGVAIRLTSGYAGGFTFAPSLGTNYKASAKLNLYFALTYHWMQTAYLYDAYLGQDPERLGSSATSLLLTAGIDF